MTKRIYVFANELGISSEELLKCCKRLGYAVPNILTKINDKIQFEIKKVIGPTEKIIKANKPPKNKISKKFIKRIPEISINKTPLKKESLSGKKRFDQYLGAKATGERIYPEDGPRGSHILNAGRKRNRFE